MCKIEILKYIEHHISIKFMHPIYLVYKNLES